MPKYKYQYKHIPKCKSKYSEVLSKLKTGDSFIIPSEDISLVFGAAQYLGIKITTRVIVPFYKGIEGTAQVWKKNNR